MKCIQLRGYDFCTPYWNTEGDKMTEHEKEFERRKDIFVNTLGEFADYISGLKAKLDRKERELQKKIQKKDVDDEQN